MGDFVETLWGALRDLYYLLGAWGVLLFVSLADLLLWRKYRFWVPRYVHGLAAGALGVILWLNWMWIRAGGEFTTRRGIVIVIFPLLVYFIFVSFGGVRAAAAERDRRAQGVKQGAGRDEPARARPRRTPGRDHDQLMRRVTVGSLAVLALAGAGIWFFASGPGSRSTRRVDDRAGVLDEADIPNFERYLADLKRESGVDIRFVFVDSLPGEALEQFAVRTARALGIGRDLDRRSVLFAYDVSDRRLRVEVGPTLQGIFTDAFVGYLMRDHVHSFFAAGNPSLGLRVTLFILHARLRRAAMGNEYDPRAAQFIAEGRRLATGGGASAGMAADRAPGFRNSAASDEARRLFAPQPTVESAYGGYLEWLRRGRVEVDVPLFTPGTQGFLSRLPIAPAFADHILFLEYGRVYDILERGDLAMLYFTDDPLVSPHFFRRTPIGWQMDLLADVRHSHEYAGGAWTWTMVERDDDITRTFADRYIKVNGFIRVAGGDNRPIPIHAAEVSPEFTRPGAEQVPGLERLTVTEAAERIAAVRGRPAVVLFYQWGNKRTRERFAAIVALLNRARERGAVVLAFSVDEPWFAPPMLPDFLRDQQAPFPAIHLYPWLEGQFTRAMEPFGIRIGSTWRTPLIALVDRDGRAIAQAQGIARQGPGLAVGEIESALRSLQGPAPKP